MSKSYPPAQEMLKVIFNEIADKTLSFGCKLEDNWKIVRYVGIEVYHPDMEYDVVWDWYRMDNSLSRKLWDINNYEVLGHPVMIWTVLDYISSHLENPSYGIDSEEELAVILWKEKNLPIEYQDIDCIEFVYELALHKWNRPK